ncbi:hypothetical protein IGI04_039735 [Brassica rapa subsp. trilocularis]|uniref:RNase H type-1 domain-containing protein n=1 Tax=Brassica rapa subsp. trilocularis TaxID=1813537 RepID=A0ABQ7KLM8_BRACM|nr:hypothetical protein IGI04_039735 [Brassica rapa subsp. trilocularis]
MSFVKSKMWELHGLQSLKLVVLHGLRSFSGVLSGVQADLIALSWSAEAMVDLKFRNVIFECCSGKVAEIFSNPLSHPPNYHAIHSIIRHIHSMPGSNLQFSFTSDQRLRLQSYVAWNGPRWLTAVLSEEATAA